jgi:multidrug transporter EmrE-like cation transporter
MSTHWFFLLAAIAVEIVATAALKSFVSAPWLVAFLPLALIGLSFALLSIALRVIPLAVAYAVWEGLGIVGIAVIGHLLFGEHLTAGRLVALAAILAGILLLERGVGDTHADEPRNARVDGRLV